MVASQKFIMLLKLLGKFRFCSGQQHNILFDIYKEEPSFITFTQYIDVTIPFN